jgi:CHAT domain
MVRILIDVSNGPDEGWTVQMTSPALNAPPPRFMPRLKGPRGGFPVARAADLPAALADKVRELATADDAAVIDDVRANIASRQPAEGDIAAFGAYLHVVLFGRHWKTIQDETGGQPIELALRWPVSEWELTRLPWEMMHAPGQDSGKYVPLAWSVPITRLVPGGQLPPGNKLRISPKVLFVVGTNLNDVSIRPGAEFFTVWERLQQEGILFDFRILQRASGQQIDDEIESFQPSIVHFICHGDEDGPMGYLELVSTDKFGKMITEKRDAPGLLGLLRTKAGTYPPVVVLNACYSGSQAGPEAARVHAPLAAALVEGGVPIVVGMGGRVSDLACRLFARRFYEALLRRQPVSEATGEGRRAGIKHGSDPDRSVDWALPMLFLADGLETDVDIDLGEVQRVCKRAELARELRKEPNPAAFCDRLEVMEAQRALLDPKQKLRVVVLEETDYEPERSGKFGKTRVLREMAARAVMEGHLPCLLTFTEGDTRPRSARDLVRWLALTIWDAGMLAGGDFGPDLELTKLLAVTAGDRQPSQLHQIVKNQYDMWRLSKDPELPSRVIAPALQLDLKTLAEFGRTRLESPGLQVVVLVDDVHQFDVAARAFTELVSAIALGSRGQPVPVVLAFSSQQEQREYASTIAILRKFIEDNSQGEHLRRIPLERFKSSERKPFGTHESLHRDPLALVYHQFLLQLRPGIVLHRRASVQAAQWFLEEVHREVMGVPSRLAINEQNRDVMRFIRSTLRQQQRIPGAALVIDQIDDERALEEYRSAGS